MDGLRRRGRCAVRVVHGGQSPASRPRKRRGVGAARGRADGRTRSGSIAAARRQCFSGNAGDRGGRDFVPLGGAGARGRADAGPGAGDGAGRLHLDGRRRDRGRLFRQGYVGIRRGPVRGAADRPGRAREARRLAGRPAVLDARERILFAQRHRLVLHGRRFPLDRAGREHPLGGGRGRGGHRGGRLRRDPRHDAARLPGLFRQLRPLDGDDPEKSRSVPDDPDHRGRTPRTRSARTRTARATSRSPRSTGRTRRRS